MDNRLVLAVLFVMLSWVSIGTYAQTTTANNVTTGNVTTGDVTTDNTTTGSGNNPTSPTSATMAPTLTTGSGNNPTSPTSATMAPTLTTGSGNNPTGLTPATTVAPTMTTASGNNVTGPPPATTVAPIMASNMTTAAGNVTVATTTAPPLVPNTTVETLPTNISRAGCGTQQLCAAQPSSCDPSTAGSCFFLAAKRQSGQNFEFALAGESDGYLAATLSTDATLGGNDTTYICAKNNSVVQFFGAVLDNGELVLRELNVNSVKGKVTGKKIQCRFAATVPTPDTRSTSFAVAISTGPYDSNNGSLGTPNTQLKSSVVNLASPNSSVTNELSANTTTAPTSHGITFQQSLTQALLICAGMLSLTML